MKLTIRTIEHLIIVLLLVICVALSKCRRDESRHQQETITALTLKQQNLDSIRNQQDKLLYTQQVLITESKQSLSTLTDSLFSLKKSQERKIKEVIAYYKGVTNTHLDSVWIPYIDSGYTKRFSDSANQRCREVIQYLIDSTIIVPKRFLKEDPGYRFGGTIQKDGILVDNISFPDTLQLRFVEKGGFLKKRTTEVQFFHSNPYVTTQSANSVLYHPPKKKQLFLKTLFFGAGVFLGSKL